MSILHELVEKWTSNGLLTGLSESGQEKMAMLLENQYRTMTDDSKVDMSHYEWQQSATLPLVRRIFGSWVEKDDFYVMFGPVDSLYDKIFVARTVPVTFYTPVVIHPFGGPSVEVHEVVAFADEWHSCIDIIFGNAPEQVMYVPFSTLFFENDCVIGFNTRVGKESNK